MQVSNPNNYEDLTKEELIARIEKLEKRLSRDERGYSRRSVISAAVGIAAAGAVGVYATGAAEAAPSGTFPVSTEDPLLKIRADRVRLVPRSTDPSVNDGTTWYRGDL